LEKIPAAATDVAYMMYEKLIAVFLIRFHGYETRFLTLRQEYELEATEEQSLEVCQLLRWMRNYEI
jgi:hypothetical protein